jgi:kinesin family protein 22
MKQRSTAATNLNESSSRSHFILQISIVIEREGKRFSSKINLIDLAGSEDNKRTGNTGIRMAESGAINKSLFVLGQVVEALNKNHPRIPYRDSKITRILQDSLGGTAIGVMIACISPEEENYLDTFNTLNFASKSSLIKNVAVINELPKKESAQERLAEFMKWKKLRSGISLGDEKENHGDKRKAKILKKIEGNTNTVDQVKERHEKAHNHLTSDVAGDLTLDSLSFSEQIYSLQSRDLRDTESMELLLKILDRIDPVAQVELYAQTQRKLLKFGNSNGSLEDLKSETQTKILDILNEGNLKEIKKLKMIGDKRALKLLEYRNLKGPFLDVSLTLPIIDARFRKIWT